MTLTAALLVSPQAPFEGPAKAEAAVSQLLSIDELVSASTYVVVATAGDHRSVWEELPGGRRIVTYTRLTIDRSIVGKPDGETWVRTLGGIVGDIGQQVSGDARIASGSKALFFLARTRDGALVVTGLAQGHFPLVPDAKGTLRLTSSPDAGALLPRRGPSISAREQLLGAAVDDAAATIERASQVRHER